MTACFAFARVRLCPGLLFALVATVPLGVFAAEPADLGIEWVTVGDPGNAADPATGRGGVAGVFQISKHEVTAGQYAAFLAAVAASDPRGLWHGGQRIDRAGKAGAFTYAARKGQEQMPVTHVAFLDCMRFANWLHHVESDPAAGGPAKSPADAARLTETGAYAIAAGGGLAAREPGARAWIPNEDEWYKAAYHHPHAAGGPPGHYWRYPTRSDDVPTIGKPGDTGPNVGIYMLHWLDVRGIPPVGSLPGCLSHYGTLDQGGSAWEWVEATVFDAHRVLRGGSALTTHEKMLKQARSNVPPSRRYPDVGFRVARTAPPTIPAPEAKPAPQAKPVSEARP